MRVRRREDPLGGLKLWTKATKDDIGVVRRREDPLGGLKRDIEHLQRGWAGGFEGVRIRLAD